MFPSKRTGSENVFDILGTIFAIMFGNVGLHVPIVSIDPAGLMDLRVATTMTLLLKLASFWGRAFSAGVGTGVGSRTRVRTFGRCGFLWSHDD